MLTWRRGVNRTYSHTLWRWSQHGLVFVMLKKVSQRGKSHGVNSDCTAGESEEAHVESPTPWLLHVPARVQQRGKYSTLHVPNHAAHILNSCPSQRDTAMYQAMQSNKKHTKPSTVTALPPTCQDVPSCGTQFLTCGYIRRLSHSGVMEIPCDSSRLLGLPMAPITFGPPLGNRDHLQYVPLDGSLAGISIDVCWLASGIRVYGGLSRDIKPRIHI